MDASRSFKRNKSRKNRIFLAIYVENGFVPNADSLTNILPAKNGKSNYKKANWLNLASLNANVEQFFRNKTNKSWLNAKAASKVCAGSVEKDGKTSEIVWIISEVVKPNDDRSHDYLNEQY